MLRADAVDGCPISARTRLIGASCLLKGHRPHQGCERCRHDKDGDRECDLDLNGSAQRDHGGSVRCHQPRREPQLVERRDAQQRSNNEKFDRDESPVVRAPEFRGGAQKDDQQERAGGDKNADDVLRRRAERVDEGPESRDIVVVCSLAQWHKRAEPERDASEVKA